VKKITIRSCPRIHPFRPGIVLFEQIFFWLKEEKSLLIEKIKLAEELKDIL
jgi:hypothetical protein